MGKIVAVSGYFDPLHSGHLEYFRKAKELGSWLVVIINNDTQCVQKKGYYLLPFMERVKIIQALCIVDEVRVSIDSDGSVCKTLQALMPNIFAKGGDRFKQEIPERRICDLLSIEIVDGLGLKIASSSDYFKNALMMLLEHGRK